MTKETLQARLTTLLPTAPPEAIEFASELVLEQICNYCNLTEAPDELLNTAALMARSLYLSAQLAVEQLQPEAKSVSRGDTTYSFASIAEQMVQIAAGNEFLTDYYAQLNAFRKMRK